MPAANNEPNGAPAVDDERPFLAVEYQVVRDGTRSGSAYVYQAPASGRIVGVQR